jgi:hypothetical protein
MAPGEPTIIVLFRFPHPNTHNTTTGQKSVACVARAPLSPPLFFFFCANSQDLEETSTLKHTLSKKMKQLHQQKTRFFVIFNEKPSFPPQEDVFSCRHTHTHMSTTSLHLHPFSQLQRKKRFLKSLFCSLYLTISFGLQQPLD